MKAFIVLLIALFAFVAISEARPTAYSALLTGSKVGTTSSDIGVAHALVAPQRAGKQLVRVFGAFSNTTANVTVASAWLTLPSGERQAQLPLGTSATLLGGRYFYGRVYLNVSARPALFANHLAVTLFDAANATIIGGNLTATPYTGIATLGGAGNATSGLGYVALALPTPASADLFDQYRYYYTSVTPEAGIVHSIAAPTAGELYGNNVTGVTPRVLAALVGGEQKYYLAPAPVTGGTSADFYGVDKLADYFSVTAAASTTGTVYPAVKKTRSLSLKSFAADIGTFTPEAFFTPSTLKKANDWPFAATKPNKAQLTLNAAPDATTGVFSGSFIFNSPVGITANETLRGLAIETSFRTTAAGLWEVSIFDQVAKANIVVGTHSTVATGTAYTKGEARVFQDIQRFIGTNNDIIIRISASGVTGTTLEIDQLALRGYVPSAKGAKLVKTLVKFAATL
jgi:hypothetical protein